MNAPSLLRAATLALALAGAAAFFVLGRTAAAEDAAYPEPTEEVLAAGKTVFLETAQPQCGICHTLDDAGTEGAIGPDLDMLKPEVSAVYAAVSQGVGIMPTFSDSLSEDEMRAVAVYVGTVTSR